jgi:hypothetical protein
MTVSGVALGLNGGCCFAYAVLFGFMQTKLLEMYGVQVRRAYKLSDVVAIRLSPPPRILLHASRVRLLFLDFAHLSATPS